MSRTLRTSDFTSGPSYEEERRKRALKNNKNHKRDGNEIKTSLRVGLNSTESTQEDDTQQLYC